jgi:Creatinine amidohydrolase
MIYTNLFGLYSLDLKTGDPTYYLGNEYRMIPNVGKPILWEEMSWKDVEKLTKSMKMAIIPTAACEQHGPHLPLSVDAIDCYEVAKRVSAACDIKILSFLVQNIQSFINCSICIYTIIRYINKRLLLLSVRMETQSREMN